jgi:hypothetical protein
MNLKELSYEELIELKNEVSDEIWLRNHAGHAGVTQQAMKLREFSRLLREALERR